MVLPSMNCRMKHFVDCHHSYVEIHMLCLMHACVQLTLAFENIYTNYINLKIILCNYWSNTLIACCHFTELVTRNLNIYINYKQNLVIVRQLCIFCA